MRRAIILLGAVVAGIVSVLRAAKAPILAGSESYAFLHSIGLSLQNAVMLQAALLLIALVLIGIAVKQYALPEESLLVLVASPAIITSLVLLDKSIIIAILVVCVILMWNTATRLTIVSILLPVTGPAGAFISLLIAITLAIRRKFIHTGILAIAAAASIAWYGPARISTAVFAELGVLGSQSIFILLLAIAGIVLWWKPATYAKLLVAASAVCIGMYLPDLRFAIAIIAAGLAGYALQVLTSRTWKLQSIRNASLLLVVCGLLFTAASTAAQAVRADPSAEFLEVQQILADLPPAKVLAAPDTRRILAALHIPVAEPEVFLAINSRRNIDEVRGIMPNYVVLDDADDAENLRFIIDNTDDFLLIYDGSVDVWVVT